MTMISTPLNVSHRKVGRSLLRRLADAMLRAWTAYMTWRLEQLAIAQLSGLSERELKDLGLTRPQIMTVARRGAVRTRASNRSFHNTSRIGGR
jgi:uncharacterized protein YjiS (DUF1127 family)